MDAETIREFCQSLEDVSESFPFDSDTLVFKTRNKMFALLSLDESPLRINVKCDPERAQQLRATFSCVLPGFHMNKTHWNTLILEGTLSADEIRKEILHSYGLIRQSKNRKQTK